MFMKIRVLDPMTMLICLSTLIVSCDGKSSRNSSDGADTSSVTIVCGEGAETTINGQDARATAIDAP